MKRSLAAVFLAVPAPVLACGTMPENHAYDMADYMVSGVLTCPSEGDECEIKVKDHLKQDAITRVAQPRRFRVLEETQIYRELEFPISNCGELFTPRLRGGFDDTAFSFFGEFSLRRQRGSRLYKVRGFEVRDVDGELIGGGVRCEPLPNDEGRDLHTCEGIIRRASTFAEGE